HRLDALDLPGEPARLVAPFGVADRTGEQHLALPDGEVDLPRGLGVVARELVAHVGLDAGVARRGRDAALLPGGVAAARRRAAHRGGDAARQAAAYQRREGAVTQGPKKLFSAQVGSPFGCVL